MTLLPAPPQTDAADRLEPIAPDHLDHLDAGTHETDDREESRFSEPEMAITSDPLLAGPTEDEIAAEAYSRYLNRGGEDGHALEDWLEAERSLRERSSGSTTREH